MKFFLGADVSKAKIDCCLQDGQSGKRKSKVVANSAAGFSDLMAWLKKHGAEDLLVVLEPTGAYHEPLVWFLTDQAVSVAMVNPKQARDYAKGIGYKNKTDKVDSIVLARFGAEVRPPVWQPPSPQARALRALVERREALKEDLQRELNRQEQLDFAGMPEQVRASLKQSINFIEEQLQKLQKDIDDHFDRHPDLRDKQDLLKTIPGVGDRLSEHFTVLFSCRTFDSASQFAAYLGLVPLHRLSGSSVSAGPRMAKYGAVAYRKRLYFPAITATRYNRQVRTLYERLIQNGKCKMAALGAAMRKLAQQCFGVIHSMTAYSQELA